MRHKLAFVLVIASFLPLVARADDSSKMAKIHEYFKLAKLDQLSAKVQNQVLDQVRSGIVQQMMGVKMTPEQKQKSDELTDKIMKIMSGAVGWDSLEPEYAKIYADAYTEQQIDDLLAFYKSPTGQAMVEKTPILLQEANAIVQQRMAAAIPQVQKLMRDYIAEQKGSQAKPNQ